MTASELLNLTNSCLQSCVMLACTDDAVQHLMWRLRHGEGLAADGPQIAVIMIGGADLAYASFKVFSAQKHDFAR